MRRKSSGDPSRRWGVTIFASGRRESYILDSWLQETKLGPGEESIWSTVVVRVGRFDNTDLGNGIVDSDYCRATIETRVIDGVPSSFVCIRGNTEAAVDKLEQQITDRKFTFTAPLRSQSQSRRRYNFGRRA